MSESIDDMLRRHPCPTCRNHSLELRMRLEARPLGTWSLSGRQPKTSAVEWPYAVCVTDGCGFETRAKVVDRSEED